MISNQILQTNLDGLKEISRVDFCICDTEGKPLASTFTGTEEYERDISFSRFLTSSSWNTSSS